MKFLKHKIFILSFMVILLSVPSLLFALEEEKIEKTYPLAREGRVYLENVSGDIVVKGWGKNEIKILARKTAQNRDSLSKVAIDIDKTDENIKIITRGYKSLDRSQSLNVSVYFDLFIPEKAQIRVKSISGRVEAFEIGGHIDIETVSGRIDVASAGKGVKCKTISGAIGLEEITGDTELMSTSGRITVSGIRGSVEANTVNGDLDIKDFSLAEEIDVESIKGNMAMQGELSPGGIYEFNTISGRISLTLHPSSNFELQTNSVSGNLKCDFEMDILRKIKRNQIQAVVGKGGASLKISSVNGDMLINKSK